MIQEKEAYPPTYDGAGGAEQLSFFKRYFYRSVNTTDDGETVPTRRFSLLSRGSVICFVSLSLMVITVLCAVLATMYDQRHQDNMLKNSSPIKQAILANFPDPSIIHHDGTWYAYATNNAAGILHQPANSTMHDFGISNVQIATSTDFSNWTLLNSTEDPLPKLGAWVSTAHTNTKPSVPKANVWAPMVLQRPSDNKFIMYYSAAVDNATRSHCVGAAISDDGPAGPFTPIETAIACPTSEGGAIDPTGFLDVDGSIYLSWKIDGNNMGHGGKFCPAIT